MASETAVLASSVGGVPEQVVDGETGLLVERPTSTGWRPGSGRCSRTGAAPERWGALAATGSSIRDGRGRPTRSESSDSIGRRSND
nr:glycosyltransferase [Halorubrum saccharovorum]